MNKVALVGYSGHAYVVIDILTAMGYTVHGFYDKENKVHNPYALTYLGQETSPTIQQQLLDLEYFVSIGDNHLRQKIYTHIFSNTHKSPINAIYPKSVISQTTHIAKEGVMIAPNVVINAQSTIGAGSICNTSCIIEHECQIGAFCHVAPGATLCGNVQVGDLSFIGANSVVKQGIRIGKNVIIGAGTVVIKDVPDNTVIVGNPQRNL